jgi:hypothetical protein
MLLNIFNNKQKKELLKLYQNEVVFKDLDINGLGLMHEVARAFLNFNDDVKKEELKFSMKENLENCLDTEHFIYSMDAINYLRDEDSTLRQSLEIAKEFYTKKEFYNIDSINLANLLYHQKQIKIIDKIDFDLIIETIIKNQ